MTPGESYISYGIISGSMVVWTGRVWSIHTQKIKLFGQEKDAWSALKDIPSSDDKCDAIVVKLALSYPDPKEET